MLTKLSHEQTCPVKIIKEKVVGQVFYWMHCYSLKFNDDDLNPLMNVNWVVKKKIYFFGEFNHELC